MCTMHTPYEVEGQGMPLSPSPSPYKEIHRLSGRYKDRADEDFKDMFQGHLPGELPPKSVATTAVAGDEEFRMCSRDIHWVNGCRIPTDIVTDMTGADAEVRIGMPWALMDGRCVFHG